jgi:polysaccharide biosynthesis protein PslH
MKILFLSRWFPFPVNNGSKIRVHNLLRGLSQVHEVVLLSFYDPREVSLDEVRKYPYCSQVQVVPWKSFNFHTWRSDLGLFSSTPRSLLDTYSPEMEVLIRQTISSQKIDMIIASQLTMASYFPAFAGLPAIFEEVELGLYVDLAFHRGSWISRLRRRLTWFKLKKYFLSLLEAFDACTVVSEQEGDIFTRTFPVFRQKVEVFPNCLRVEDYQSASPVPVKYQLIFSGSFRYRPNYQAMLWFLNEVYPLVLEQIPDVSLVVTGDPDNLPLPDLKNVTLAGYVDDIKSLIVSCSLSIVPLWYGGGTRLKLLEALALGTPVVATSKGAEGLHVQHGENILIADQPDQFAAHVIRLLNDADLRKRLSANGRQLVHEQYNWRTILPKFLRLVEKVAAG